MENRFLKNLKELMNKNNLSQRDLGQLTGVSPATINNYLNKKGEPSLNFLCAIKEKFGYDLDTFIFGEPFESKQIIAQSNNLEKFVGTYMLYCYNSSEYKGKISSYSKSTLKYTVLTVLNEETPDGLKVVANFLKDRDQAESLKEQIESANIKNREDLHKKGETFYEGSLQASITQIFISLKNTLLSDQSLIILNNPPSNKTYIGGLGTANSVSRGREHMPCIQFVLLSKKTLHIPDGELYNLLSLGVSDVNVEIEAEQLINLFKNLYINNANIKDDLTEFQKQKIFENSLNNILNDLIDANMFRFAKVSNMEDDDYYRIIKDE